MFKLSIGFFKNLENFDCLSCLSVCLSVCLSDVITSEKHFETVRPNLAIFNEYVKRNMEMFVCQSVCCL